MNQTRNCPRCGRPNPGAHSFCSGCGTSLSSSSSSFGNGWKVFFGAFALLVGLIWAAAIYTKTNPPAQLAPPQAQSLVGQNSPAAQPAPTAQSLALTTAQHLSEAKRALTDGYRPDKDPQKAKWGEVAAAKWHLKAIGAGTPEYREAQELLKEVARREKQAEIAKKQAERGAESDETAEADAAGAASDIYSSRSSTPSASAPSSPAYSSPPSTTSGGSSSDYYTNTLGVRVHRPTSSEKGPPPGASAQCADGSYSFSMSRRGTCSHHGGVARWL